MPLITKGSYCGHDLPPVNGQLSEIYLKSHYGILNPLRTHCQLGTYSDQT